MALPILPILAAGGALIFLLGKGGKKTAATPVSPIVSKPPVAPPAIPPTPWVPGSVTPPAIPPVPSSLPGWMTPPPGWTAPPPGWTPPASGWIPPWVAAEAKSKEPGVVADDMKAGYNDGFTDAAYSSDWGTRQDKAKYASSPSYKAGYDSGWKEYSKTVSTGGYGARAGLDVMSFEDPRFMMYVNPMTALPRVGQTMRPTDIRGFSHVHHPSALRADMRRSVGRTRVNTAVAGAVAAGCCPSSGYDAPSGCQCQACAGTGQQFDAYGNRIDQTEMLRMLQYAGWRY